MPSVGSAIATVGEEAVNTALRSIREVGRSVIVFSLLPVAAARAGPAPFAQTTERSDADQSLCFLPAATCASARGACPFAQTTERSDADQSLFSPCCHLRRCRPNHETMIAASRNGIIALEIAAPSPSCPAMIAR